MFSELADDGVLEGVEIGDDFDGSPDENKDKITKLKEDVTRLAADKKKLDTARIKLSEKHDEIDKKIDEIKGMIHNNFVDLYIASDIPVKYNLSSFMAMVQNDARKIEPNIYDEKTYIDIDNITEEIQNGYKNFNVINLCNNFIDNMNVDKETRDKLISEIARLYNDCTNKYNEHED